jgi:splicing factor, arginine/serine-rich 17
LTTTRILRGELLLHFARELKKTDKIFFLRYVQFSEYGSFVRCLDEFRAMKLVRKEADKLVAVNIQVTFDTTKHLSDSSSKRRKVIRDRLIDKDREKAEEEEKKLQIERDIKEKEK